MKDSRLRLSNVQNHCYEYGPIMKTHRGFTLIEMLVVVTVGAALLATTATLLYAIMRSNETALDALQENAEINRFVEQFREDAHAAIEITLAKGALKNSPVEWSGKMQDGRTVVYRSTPGEILRIELKGADTAGRESFALPQYDVFEIEQIASTPLNKLYIPAREGSAVAPIVVEFAPGKDHRFEKKSTQQGLQ
jgi:prepilin-type N-terminal cleavage/methylation domain-containing protein